MRKKIHKMFWAWDFDKEEKWLNQMSAEGMQLVSVGYWTYVFEKGPPSEYGVRIELLEKNLKSEETKEYIQFIEGTGAEYIGNVLNWVYFRKKLTEGAFEIYSDTGSKLMHLERILKLLRLLGAMEIVIGFYNLFLFFYGHALALNLYAGMFCVLLGGFILIGLMRVHKLKRTLQGNTTLFE